MNTTDNLLPMTVRLEPVVSEALANKAQSKGQEVADYAADLLTNHVLGDVRKIDPSVGKRLTAEIEVKAKAIAMARRITKRRFDPNVTLKVFQEIKTDGDLRSLYRRAIGGGPGDERGNHVKARINRSLGAAIKTAIGATPVKTNGKPVKVQVSGEYIFSYTLLDAPPTKPEI